MSKKGQKAKEQELQQLLALLTKHNVSPQRFADLIDYIMLDYRADMKRVAAEAEGREYDAVRWEIFREQYHLLIDEFVMPRVERREAERLSEGTSVA